jgi:hypothetical protein
MYSISGLKPYSSLQGNVSFHSLATAFHVQCSALRWGYALSKISTVVDTDCCIASCRHTGHNAVLIYLHNKRQTYRERHIWTYIGWRNPMFQYAVDSEINACVNDKSSIAGKNGFMGLPNHEKSACGSQTSCHWKRRPKQINSSVFYI